MDGLRLKSLKKLFNPKFIFLLSVIIVLLAASVGAFYLFNDVYLKTASALAELHKTIANSQVINVDPIKSAKFESELSAYLEKGIQCR